MSQTVDTVLVAYASEAVIALGVSQAAKLGGRVVVVDHGDGRAAEVAAGLDATTFWDPGNPGFGAGQNRGIEETTSPFVLLCNPDAHVHPEAVMAGAGFLAAHPQVAAVQGVIFNRTTGMAERSQGRALGPAHLIGRALGARKLLAVPAVRRLARRSATLRDHADRVPTAPAEVESLAATALLVRRSAFDSVGGFDTRYFLYGEDLDLCRRLRRAGWSLAALPDVWAVHESGGSADSFVSRELHWWGGTMQYAARWWGGRAWALAVLAAVARCCEMGVRNPRRARDLIRALLVDPMAARRASNRRRSHVVGAV